MPSSDYLNRQALQLKLNVNTVFFLDLARQKEIVIIDPASCRNTNTPATVIYSIPASASIILSADKVLVPAGENLASDRIAARSARHQFVPTFDDHYDTIAQIKKYAGII